ncbi:hypothetical protein ACFPL7_03210 [Dongia soli]|uniref:Uncharacterized protein n=1 Tax=Dongia soli TaxID=600628 RepID=A0ABU5EED9_9PROT|nr:hypothetical protein [Dongia soli]MDY0884701.1 hypothetical protein [Dongia soli]
MQAAQLLDVGEDGGRLWLSVGSLCGNDWRCNHGRDQHFGIEAARGNLLLDIEAEAQLTGGAAGGEFLADADADQIAVTQDAAQTPQMGNAAAAVPFHARQGRPWQNPAGQQIERIEQMLRRFHAAHPEIAASLQVSHRPAGIPSVSSAQRHALAVRRVFFHILCFYAVRQRRDPRFAQIPLPGK